MLKKMGMSGTAKDNSNALVVTLEVIVFLVFVFVAVINLNFFIVFSVFMSLGCVLLLLSELFFLCFIICCSGCFFVYVVCVFVVVNVVVFVVNIVVFVGNYLFYL